MEFALPRGSNDFTFSLVDFSGSIVNITDTRYTDQINATPTLVETDINRHTGETLQMYSGIVELQYYLPTDLSNNYPINNDPDGSILPPPNQNIPIQSTVAYNPYLTTSNLEIGEHPLYFLNGNSPVSQKP